MTCRTFAVKISPAPESGFGLSVIGSPAGEAGGFVQRMADPAEIELLRHTLADPRHLNASGSIDDRGPSTPSERRSLMERIGAELFANLVPDGIRSAWEQSRGGALSSGERLRVEVHVDPRDELLQPVLSLPWELSFCPQTSTFLGLDPANTVVRYLDVGRPALGVRFEEGLRVVVAEARPRGVPELDLSLEASELTAAWANTPGVEIHYLERATPSRLRRSLVSERPHILHFMGHGYSDPRTGWGGLVLESGDGASDELGGPELRDLFQGVPDLRLVVLNACDTARPGGRGEPFAGAAAALTLAGIPAVVAMQFPISDRAAILFSEAFYRMLAAGRDVDEAVVEGRLAIHLDDRRSLEWVTPALFMRGGGASGDGLKERPEEGMATVTPQEEATDTPAPSETSQQRAVFNTQIEGDTGKVFNIDTAGDLYFGD